MPLNINKDILLSREKSKSYKHTAHGNWKEVRLAEVGDRMKESLVKWEFSLMFHLWKAIHHRHQNTQSCALG